MITLTAADGTSVHASDRGSGPTILMIGPGLDDGSRTEKVAAILAERFRVIGLRRRQYRLDLKAEHPAPFSVAEEVDDVLTLARHVGRPSVVYGHSSGGVVALEAVAAAPSLFAGAVIFEPAAVIETPLAGVDGAAITAARAAIAGGRPDVAMRIFTRVVAGYPAWQAWLVGALVALVPRYRRLVPGQIDDLAAMDQLGDRRAAYAEIPVPTVLLGGDRSPARNTAVLEALAKVLPGNERVVMRGRDHSADVKDPKQVARIVETLADRVLSP
ncbi:pimeloyl-ACP methyl ester carboxylesterase [Nocardia tenerifensis]|uniref:Pimeloyl-ACP methyl ester carboxylesterase n=1 Tax=Nocardia tenerifensis TaxID=228006 RepID=A0A318JXG3_9NOCA|nr:alpha/beta hydrolase [Nocardia tenerifensis]PXX61658.1 pimeloyl-ACP methyl ester carboxylesterase [Nocardia tenerifensis]